MKLNIKARLRNKTFLITAVTLTVTFVYQLLSLLGVVPGVSENQVTELLCMGINMLAFLGVVVDPTTEGIGDSKRALTYYTQYDEREV